MFIRAGTRSSRGARTPRTPLTGAFSAAEPLLHPPRRDDRRGLGACSNANSSHDRTIVFEHYGCPHHALGTMRVYLDDGREAPAGWTRTRTVEETIDWLERGEVTHLSLDHDLGDDTKGTGYDVLLWIERQVQLWDYKPPLITIHSENASARVKMKLAVEAIGRLREESGRD